MTYAEFKEKLISTDPSKLCFKFLANRVADNNYRGIQISQHNRYDIDTVTIMLQELYNFVGENKMVIRTTDLSKRPANTPEEKTYAEYVTALSNKLGRCTQDSVRKNLFVDLHRMDLIERYNESNEKLSSYACGTKKYVKLSKNGIDFIKTNKLFDKRLKYTRAIDTLTKGLAEELLDIDILDGYITDAEFQFFFSFVGMIMDNHLYTKTELLGYIKEFRSLSKFQRKGAISIIKQYCDPDTFKGDKTQKRDYHNWINETQQIFMLMSQTSYFEVSDGVLSVRIGKDSLFENKTKYIRSANEKQEYFKKHSVCKMAGFELHHIVPLCWANNLSEFTALDVWQNLIYIDGYSHSRITQNNNKNVKLVFAGNDIAFCDYNNDKIYCKEKENVLYNVKNQNLMSEYNIELLNSATVL